MAHRMKSERLDQPARFVRRIDMRDDDSQCAVVQRPGAFIDGAAADAHERRNAGRQRRETELRDLLRGDCAVLGIDEQPVVTGSFC